MGPQDHLVSHCSGQITVGVAQLTRSCGPTRSCGLAIRSAILHTILHMIVQIHTTILWGLKIMQVSHCSGQITSRCGSSSAHTIVGPTRSCGLAIWSAILHIVQVGHSSHDHADPHNHPVGPQDHVVSHCSGQITVAQLTRSCGPTRSCGLAIRSEILHIVWVGHSSHDCADRHNHPVGPQDHAGQPLFRPDHSSSAHTIVRAHTIVWVGHSVGNSSHRVGWPFFTRLCRSTQPSCGASRSCGCQPLFRPDHSRCSSSAHMIVRAHTIVWVGHLVSNSSHHAGQPFFTQSCGSTQPSCGATRSCGSAIVQARSQ